MALKCVQGNMHLRIIKVLTSKNVVRCPETQQNVIPIHAEESTGRLNNKCRMAWNCLSKSLDINPVENLSRSRSIYWMKATLKP